MGQDLIGLVVDVLQSDILTDAMLDTLLRIETDWKENLDVVKQILSVYIILSENSELYFKSFIVVAFHRKLLKSMIIKNFASLLQTQISNHCLFFGIISVCRNLSSSNQGRLYLQSIHIFELLLQGLPINGYDVLLCRNISSIILSMNMDGFHIIFFSF